MENCCSWTFPSRGGVAHRRSSQVHHHRPPSPPSSTYRTRTPPHVLLRMSTYTISSFISHRKLYLDESASMDRNENARKSRLHERRYTHKDNIRYGQRRFRKHLKGSKHMTIVTGYSEAGVCHTCMYELVHKDVILQHITVYLH